jgi:hypothetical protein
VSKQKSVSGKGKDRNRPATRRETVQSEKTPELLFLLFRLRFVDWIAVSCSAHTFNDQILYIFLFENGSRLYLLNVLPDLTVGAGGGSRHSLTSYEMSEKIVGGIVLRQVHPVYRFK